MKASDIAFLIHMLDKYPSKYRGHKELLEELQEIFSLTQSYRYGPVTHFPVMPELRVEAERFIKKHD